MCGCDDGAGWGESEVSGGIAAAAITGGCGSSEVGDSGLLSILVSDMVKHSVHLVV